MLTRALTYLRRKSKRSALLFILLFLISLSLFIGLSVWNSIDSVTKEVQQQLGTSFIMTKPPIQVEDSEYYRRVPTTTNNMLKVYCGPMMDREFAQQIMQIDGITVYNGELEEWCGAGDFEIVSGMSDYKYQKMMRDPEELEYRLGLQEKGEIGSVAYYEAGRRDIMIYGNTDSSLYDKFRTGAFELVEGRHITADDRQKTLISEEIANINHLKVGDTVQICVYGNHVMDYKGPKKVLGSIELEIVGIFHVNGYQPTGEWVHENDITYNWLLTDEDTVEKMAKVQEQNYYVDFVNDFCYKNLTFFVDEPERLDEIIEQVRKSGIEGVDILQISKDDTMYKSTVEPLQSIGNLIMGMMFAIVIGCAIVLLIVFTMWVKSRKQEIAIYLAMGVDKVSILGQLILETVIVAVIACAVAFPLSQPIANAVGNDMLANSIAEAQPEGPKEYTIEELRQAAYGGGLGELYHYENSTYSGPEHIDFSLGIPQFALLIILELLIIIGAICKGGSFIFKLEPRQIMSELR